MQMLEMILGMLLSISVATFTLSCYDLHKDVKFWEDTLFY